VYNWFFTDIVASANPKIATDGQTHKIMALNDLIRKTGTFRKRTAKSCKILPTGDGVAIGFKDTPEKPLMLAIELHKELAEYNMNKKNPNNRLDIRIGLDTGPVFHIVDLNNKDNVWGPGIIYARRVMDLGRPKSILASDRFANTVSRLRPEYKKIMHFIGDYSVKHDEKIPIYNVYGIIYDTEIGTKNKPHVRIAGRSSAFSEIKKSLNTFLFTNIEITLNITSPKTMMAHHTWLWEMINQTKEPVERVFYYLDGDEERNFPDLNVRVTDDKGNKLNIKSLNANQPYHKEFFVQLARPFKPGQKGRSIKLEYDWEETKRHFFYRFASDCRKFRFLLTIPKGMPISQKVARVSPETGDITYASTPATVRYLNNKTEVEWAAKNIPAFDAYRFDW